MHLRPAVLGVLGLASAVASPLLAQLPPLAGKVLTGAGAPAHGAAVQIRWRTHPELPGLVGHSLGDAGIAQCTAPVAADGRFRLQPPHGGPFELLAVLGDDTERSPVLFPVMAGAFVELRLARPTWIAGTVLDAAGELLAGAAVRLQPQNTSWTRLAGYRQPQARAVAVTDAQGAFRLPLPDSYLRGPGWEPFVTLDFAVPGQWLPQEVLLRPTAACAALQLALVPAPLETGTVLGADGQPLAGALVFDSTAPARRVVTGKDGSFALPARFRRDLVVTAPGHACRRVPPLVRGVPLPPPPVALARGAVVRARLVDPDGRPLSAAPVLWSEPLASGLPLESTAVTDADGRVAFDRAGGDGAVLGFVAVAGFYRQFARSQLPFGQDLGDVVVAAPRPVRGQVLAADGTPVPGARLSALSILPLKDEPAWITYTDHGGRFTFPDLPAIGLRLGVDAGARGHASASLAAAAATATLRLDAAGAVTGVVQDFDGKGVAGAWVTLVRSGGTGSGGIPGPSPLMTAVCTHTDGEGRFRFVGLAAAAGSGPWQVLANCIADGLLYGGGADAETDGEPVTVVLRRQER